jgi:segregation and condensation protein B
MKNNNIQIIEALIFANDSPLPARKIKDILQEGTEKEIKELIAQINKKYEDINSPLQVIEVAGGYQIVTRSSYASWITKLYASRSAHRLTQQALETLAIIAYKQEITKQEIESIRGVNVDSVIRTLIERDLITVTGRQKAPGSPLLYSTTKYFLEYFGLKDLSNLPKLKEIDELLKSDEKFLESLDQVSLHQMTPEELGIRSMENNKDEEKAEDVDDAKAETETKTATEDNDENK